MFANGMTQCPHFVENGKSCDLYEGQKKCVYYVERPKSKGRCIFYRTQYTGPEGHCDQFKCEDTSKKTTEFKWPSKEKKTE